MLFDLSFFRQRGSLRLAAVVLAMAAAAAPVAATSDESYYSVVESGTTVERAGDAQPAEENQLVFAGDRLTTTFSARAEVVLADAVVHVGGGSEVVFAALAGSADGDADDSLHLLLLERGELLVTSAGATATRIDTDNATVFLDGAGAYRIDRDTDSTTLIVRRGEAELRTRQGTVVVAADEHAWVLGDGTPVVEPAGGADALERWAAALDARRDRLASLSRLRSWWGGFWSVFWEDDGFDAVFHSLDIGDCEDGVTVCRHGSGGGAARTRPPRTMPDQDDPAEEEPGTPDDGTIAIALRKPLADPTEPVPSPAGEPPPVTDVTEIPSTADVAVAGIEGPEAAPPKPSADEAPRPDATATVGNDVSTPGEAPATSEPSSSDTSTADSSTSDSSSASAEPAATSYDTTTTTTDASSSDSGSLSPEPSAPEAPPPPEHGIEPNR